MMHILEIFFELIECLWTADAAVRDRSVLGESGIEEDARKGAAKIIVWMTVLILIAVLLWDWLVD